MHFYGIMHAFGERKTGDLNLSDAPNIQICIIPKLSALDLRSCLHIAPQSIDVNLYFLTRK